MQFEVDAPIFPPCVPLRTKAPAPAPALDDAAADGPLAAIAAPASASRPARVASTASLTMSKRLFPIYSAELRKAMDRIPNQTGVKAEVETTDDGSRVLTITGSGEAFKRAYEEFDNMILNFHLCLQKAQGEFETLESAYGRPVALEHAGAASLNADYYAMHGWHR
mmetsp:Transcript_61485/g.197931  ORF Transcript_61485/g.197931 Transcript_61485/m.197931 type:complete len:166 (-) Transcript_61485:95-592(-)